MRKIGVSDSFFYYTSAYNSTFSIHISLQLPKWDPDAFRAAFEKALHFYPELAYRPVIFNNQLYASPNEESIVLVPEDGKRRDLGTDETNGYLFYLTYKDDTVCLNYYHGLTDVVGMLKLLTQVLAEYASDIDFSFTEEERGELEALLRKEVPSLKDLDTDPYRRLGDVNAFTEYSYDNPGAYEIPADYPDDCGYLHSYSYLLQTDEFLRKTVELGVSFAPLLVMIFSEGLEKTFASHDKPLICMVPANMRALVGSETSVNCSDSLIIPYDRDSSRTPEETCRIIKAMMTKQRDRGNYLRMMGRKTRYLEMFEANPAPIEEQAYAICNPREKRSFRPISCAMTFPGKISFSSGIDRMLKDVSVFGWIKADFGLAYTFRNKMEFNLQCRTDSDVLANNVLTSFRDLGLNVCMSDKGRVYSEMMDLRKLKHI